MDPAKRKLIIATVLALAAAAACWLWLSSRERALLLRAKPRRVLAAARYVPAYTRLDEGHLAFREVPEEYLAKGALERMDDAVGLVTLAPLSANEPVLFNKLARQSQSLAAAVPEGRRAFSVAVDPVSGVSGLVRPGDLVDVLLLADEGSGGRPMAATLFQAVRVVAVGARYAVDDKAETEGGGTVSLALTPQECEVALFAASRGRLHLTLRPTGDREVEPLKAVDYAAVLARVSQGEPRKVERGVEIIRGGQ